MVNGKLFGRLVRKFGPNLKRWPISLNPQQQQEFRKLTTQQKNLMEALGEEEKLDILLHSFSIPVHSPNLAPKIQQTMRDEELQYQKTKNVLAKNHWSWLMSFQFWVQQRLRRYLLMPASLVLFLSGGWVLGQHYQQPDLEIGDFYAEPALAMIIEE